MEIVSREIRQKGRSDIVKLTFIGDVHIGGRDCDINRLRACVKRIAEDESHYWIGVGDYGEYINISDKRFDPKEVSHDFAVEMLSDFAYQQTLYVKKEFEKIRGRCLGLHMGNHEKTIATRYHSDIHRRLCDLMSNDFGDLNLGYAAITKLRIARCQTSRIVKLCGHHGAGGGRKNGASINRMEDLVLAFPGNHIYYKGHDHKRFAWVDTAIVARDDVDKEAEFPMGFACTGSFKKTYEQGTTSYAEQAMCKPSPLGVVSFKIKAHGNEGIEIDAHTGTNGLPA